MTSIGPTSLAISNLGTSSIARAKTKREEIFAEQAAQEANKQLESASAKTEFLKFAKMSPAERIRAAYLKEHGLSEESLASLPKEEREKIEEEIKKLIKTKLGVDETKGSGQIVDITV